jgi:DNA (cytosine-5)-methyltransferase 1
MAHTKRLKTFHLFAGAGGGILADLLLKHTPVGACEIEPYPRNVLLQRQRDGVLPDFPIWDDINTLDGTPWRGSIDVLSGGFPCQDISAAGKGAGISGERSGLWKEYARLIGEMRPRFVFAENSPLLRTRGLGVVLEDLASLGYNARWGIIGARDVGAPHKRDRMWVLAHTNGIGVEGHELCKPDLPTRPSSGEEGSDLAYADGPQRKGSWISGGVYPKYGNPYGASAWCSPDPADAIEPSMGRVAHGVANRVDRLKAIGNGQVPQCAAMAFNTLSAGLI